MSRGNISRSHPVSLVMLALQLPRNRMRLHHLDAAVTQASQIDEREGCSRLYQATPMTPALHHSLVSLYTPSCWRELETSLSSAG